MVGFLQLHGVGNERCSGQFVWEIWFSNNCFGTHCLCFFHDQTVNPQSQTKTTLGFQRRTPSGELLLQYSMHRCNQNNLLTCGATGCILGNAGHIWSGHGYFTNMSTDRKIQVTSCGHEQKCLLVVARLDAYGWYHVINKMQSPNILE